jgi:hypothetical protein
MSLAIHSAKPSGTPRIRAEQRERATPHSSSILHPSEKQQIPSILRQHLAAAYPATIFQPEILDGGRGKGHN